MKKQTIQSIASIVLLLLTTSAFAQNISTDYANKMNTIFEHLEKNRVPNDILIDQSIDFIDVHQFDGQSLNNENLVDIHRFRDIYYTLASGRMVSNNDMVSPQVLSTRFQNARQPRTITLTGLYMKYAQFKENAHQNNLITIQNNQIYDAYNGNTWKNPYDVKETFAIAPSISKYEGKAIYVKIPSNLWFTNQNNIQWLKIDFNDGNGYQTVNIGQTKNVLYSSLGIKEWKYQLRLTNGQTKYSHSYIKIEKPPVEGLNSFSNNQVQRVINCPNDITDPNVICIEADEAFENQFGRALVTIDYIGNNTTITKPLIVVEGLDMGHILNPESPFGETTIADFQIDISNDDNELQNLLFTNQQYDIIYVDWQNGTDRLERNALVLETVINWVNNQKAQQNISEPNVVLGQSMGGVIARYALRNMEDKNMNHDTRLYISFDAPHQGANVPLAGQYAYQHLANWAYSTNIDNWIFPLLNISLDINGVLNLLDEPAPRQLLKNRVADNLGIENSTHTAWQSELQSTGYPQLTEKNIAVSNGSECAITQEFLPGDELYKVTGNAKPSVFTSIITNLIPGLETVSSIFSTVLLNSPAPLIGLAPGGRSKFEAEFRGKAQPLNQVTEIYKGRLTIKKNILFVIPVNAHITNKSINSSSNILPFDYYHGGETPLEIDFNGFNFRSILGNINVNLEHEGSFDFIPTPSALDIGGGNTTLTHQNYLRAYTGGMLPTAPLQTPFDAFVTAFGDTADNERHIDILPRNGDFIASYLEDATPETFDCSAFCSNNEIIGPDWVCSSGSYSLPRFTGSVNWTSSNTNIATINNNGVLTKQSDGIVTITGSATGECGTVFLQKVVRIGLPTNNDFNVEIIANSTINCNRGYDVVLNNNSEITPLNVEWTTTGDVTLLNGWLYIANINTGSNIGCINANVITECGTKRYANCFQPICNNDPGGISGFRVAPNPAQEIITLDFNLTQQPENKKIEYRNLQKWKEGFIIDLNNKVWKNFKVINNKKMKLDVSQIPSGVYRLLIRRESGKVDSQLLVIE